MITMLGLMLAVGSGVRLPLNWELIQLIGMSLSGLQAITGFSVAFSWITKWLSLNPIPVGSTLGSLLPYFLSFGG